MKALFLGLLLAAVLSSDIYARSARKCETLKRNIDLRKANLEKTPLGAQGRSQLENELRAYIKIHNDRCHGQSRPKMEGTKRTFLQNVKRTPRDFLNMANRAVNKTPLFRKMQELTEEVRRLRHDIRDALRNRRR